MIESIEIANERVRDATQFQEAIPLRVVAGDAGSFPAENDADLAQANFLGHLRKAGAEHYARAGVSQVFVHHFDLRAGPTQLDGALAQLVLTFGGLAIHEHLRGRGLANVNISRAAQVRFLDFEIIAHGFGFGPKGEDGREPVGPTSRSVGPDNRSDDCVVAA